MTHYIHNNALFNGSYLKRVISNDEFPRKRVLPKDAPKRLKKLLEIWNDVRPALVSDRPESTPLAVPFAGLPPTVEPEKKINEEVVKNAFVSPVLKEVLGYHFDEDRTLFLDGLLDEERKKKQNDRPDLILFREKKRLNAARKQAGKVKKTKALSFCRDADFILDAKKFSKGVGADEDRDKTTDTSAAQDIDQVDRYLRGSGKTWGILTNGRSWRLMRGGKKQEHLRFDLVMFLESLRLRSGVMAGQKVKEAAFTEADMAVFGLFWYFFGQPAVGGGYLDVLYREGEANTRRVSDILRDNAYRTVQIIAEGFWKHPKNDFPQKREMQSQLDELRELALTFLYRLLFILKAEAQGLLPMKDENGGDTTYAGAISTKAIFDQLIRQSAAMDLSEIDTGFNNLKWLFELINSGGTYYDIPAYNGGLFDPEQHQTLDKLRLDDNVVHRILHRLIYLDESEPVPYADLDVRDFGDIYEGLLEQRLVREKVGDGFRLALRNKKSERKASGSYFTPDSLVEHIVRETVMPLLDACKADPHKLLALKILDPAMGSGHFLVKVVDVMAWHLTLNCDPGDVDKGVPNDNGPVEYAYWKRKVVESCIYGVDVNPMAVELAKVSLWLHSASKGKPLSFLDHHLKCGNSLIGADLRDVARPAMERKDRKGGCIWMPRPVQRDEPPLPETSRKKKKKAVSKQLELPFEINTNLFSGILESVTKILQRPSSTPKDVKSKRRDYLMKIEQKLQAHRLLCDLWCAQWFMSEPDKEGILVYESPKGLYVRVKKVCGIADEQQRFEAVEKLLNHGFVKKIEAARTQGFGPRPMRFFHWQLEFPEAAFTPDGQMRETYGFDAVVGNPPWDKIKPAKRDFYGPFSDEVAGRQGNSLNALIARLEKEIPELADGWKVYEKTTVSITSYLKDCNAYRHQTAVVEGKKTGGDPDLFRYFTERAVHCVQKGGAVGFVVPCTLWQGQGCTGLRKLLFEQCTLRSLYTFENYRKWAFAIDSRFKFTALVFSTKPPGAKHSFPAAFMLRDTQVLEGLLKERVVQLSGDYVKAVSPSTLALIDNKSDGEARFIRKIHETHPMLGEAESGWNAVYRTDLHMTADAWRFKTRKWMKDRGFTRVLPMKDENGKWEQQIDGPETASLPENLPSGGEYWVSADADFYRERGYIEKNVEINGDETAFFIHPDDAELEKQKRFDPQKDFRRIFPGERYTALYEGRMVHLFDHAQKRYLRGEGRKAIWEDIPVSDKRLEPRVFLSKLEAGKSSDPRIGFCDVTGATNERSILAALIGSENIAGHKVPNLVLNSIDKSLILNTILCSFCSDTLMRLRISTNLTWNFLYNLAIPKFENIPPETRKEICESAAKLNCTTPELAEVWEAVFPDSPWTYHSAERDEWQRAELRARLDALVAGLYGLTVEEYARVLTGFPLLDRDQPNLPGDYFLTEGDEKSKIRGKENEHWIDTDWGIFELKPRSFITRDVALNAYMNLKNYPKPQDLEKWYENKAGLDPNGVLSRFKIGEKKDLLDRIAAAKKLGAVPYIPAK